MLRKHLWRENKWTTRSLPPPSFESPESAGGENGDRASPGTWCADGRATARPLHPACRAAVLAVAAPVALSVRLQPDNTRRCSQERLWGKDARTKSSWCHSTAGSEEPKIKGNFAITGPSENPQDGNYSQLDYPWLSPDYQQAPSPKFLLSSGTGWK